MSSIILLKKTRIVVILPGQYIFWIRFILALVNCCQKVFITNLFHPFHILNNKRKPTQTVCLDGSVRDGYQTKG